jgi:ABC-type multidrug transport system fused ATPase/permease subunit
MSLLYNIKILFKNITLKRRKQLCGLLFFTVVCTLLEMASLSAILPFLKLLSDSTYQYESNFLYELINNFLNLNISPIVFTGLLFIALSLATTIARVLFTMVSYRISFGLGFDIGTKIYSNILYQPYSWHVLNNSSDTLAGLEKINYVVFSVIIPILQGTAALIITFGIGLAIFIINPLITITAGSCLLLMYWFTSFVLKKHLDVNSKIITKNLTKRMQALQEGIGAIREVIIDNSQSVYINKFSKYESELRSAQALNNLIGAAPRYIIETIAIILFSIIAICLSTYQQNGFLESVSIIGVLAVGSQKILPQIQLIYYSWSSIINSRSQLHDVNLFLELKNKHNEEKYLNDCNLDLKLSNDNVFISLNNITFSYLKKNNNPIINSINLNILKGTVIGLIGKSGSGKSTLLDIIMCLLIPDEGEVKINGHKINDINVREWQKIIGHVPQSIYLSDDSIMSNIAFGVESKNIDKIRARKCAEIAKISDFIETLEEGYDTFVGERGVRLSGGQSQRIGIARALYKNPEVLILDEATSALDAETESAVINSIMINKNKITILMISHKLSTLQHCNEIIELESGSIKKKVVY